MKRAVWLSLYDIEEREIDAPGYRRIKLPADSVEMFFDDDDNLCFANKRPIYVGFAKGDWPVVWHMGFSDSPETLPTYTARLENPLWLLESDKGLALPGHIRFHLTKDSQPPSKQMVSQYHGDVDE